MKADIIKLSIFIHLSNSYEHALYSSEVFAVFLTRSVFLVEHFPRILDSSSISRIVNFSKPTCLIVCPKYLIRRHFTTVYRRFPIFICSSMGCYIFWNVDKIVNQNVQIRFKIFNHIKIAGSNV